MRLHEEVGAKDHTFWNFIEEYLENYANNCRLLALKISKRQNWL